MNECRRSTPLTSLGPETLNGSINYNGW